MGPVRSFRRSVVFSGPSTNASENKDADGHPFVKERIELARKHASFWQNYKFMNPVTKKIEAKHMYCTRLEETAVCGGVYKLD